MTAACTAAERLRARSPTAATHVLVWTSAGALHLPPRCHRRHAAAVPGHGARNRCTCAAWRCNNGATSSRAWCRVRRSHLRVQQGKHTAGCNEAPSSKAGCCHAPHGVRALTRDVLCSTRLRCRHENAVVLAGSPASTRGSSAPCASCAPRQTAPSAVWANFKADFGFCPSEGGKNCRGAQDTCMNAQFRS